MYGLILTTLVLTIATCTEAYTVDLCTPCFPNNLSLEENLHNFRRSLHHVQLYFSIRISNLAQENMFDVNGHTGEYDEQMNASPFHSEDASIDSMLAAYRTLTDLRANLTLFNHIRSRRLVNHDEHAILTPVCHLYKALRCIYTELPCRVCRTQVSAPPSTRTSLTAAINFVEFTLRRGKWLMEHIRNHFETA